MNNENNVNNERPNLVKRFGAYIIDLLIVALLASTVATTFTNTEKYEQIMKEINQVTEQYKNQEIELEEYQTRYRDLSYDYSVYSGNVSIIMLIASVVYYVIMAYFCHGITLGKYLMKTRIVSANDKELNIFNYLLRSLIANNVLSSLAGIIMLNTLSKTDYLNIEPKVNSVFSLLLIVTVILLMYRKDGRGLHDLIANTKVVNISYKKEENSDEKKIEDATIIEEKKDVKEKKKVNKTTKTRGQKKEGK